MKILSGSIIFNLNLLVAGLISSNSSLPGQRDNVQITLNVDKPLTPMQSNWPLLLLPPIGIIAYVFSRRQRHVLNPNDYAQAFISNQA